MTNCKTAKQDCLISSIKSLMNILNPPQHLNNLHLIIYNGEFQTKYPTLIYYDNVLYSHLSLGEIESLGELLPLGAHHVLVLLEGLLELEELARAERRPDPLGLPEGQQERREVRP